MSQSATPAAGELVRVWLVAVVSKNSDSRCFIRRECRGSTPMLFLPSPSSTTFSLSTHISQCPSFQSLTQPLTHSHTHTHTHTHTPTHTHTQAMTIMARLASIILVASLVLLVTSYQVAASSVAATPLDQASNEQMFQLSAQNQWTASISFNNSIANCSIWVQYVISCERSSVSTA